MKYTNADAQRIIDDLDYARAFFGIYEVEGEKHPEQENIINSLKHASHLLMVLPDDVIESIDKEFS